jgi:itaconyl-CoA hydratase
MSATRTTNYFEDFAAGMKLAHRRGRTFSQDENARYSFTTMNTAQAHWNFETMKEYFGGKFERPLMNAALVMAAAVGLSSQDMSENVLHEVQVDKVRIPLPCFPGDTVFACSTVLEAIDGGPTYDTGTVRYLIELRNQRSELVCSMERVVALKKRAHWSARDADFAERLW